MTLEVSDLLSTLTYMYSDVQEAKIHTFFFLSGLLASKCTCS